MDSEDSFALHSWMIARLTEESGSDRQTFSRYVVATCYERMHQRMNYRVFQSFRNALKDLQTFEFHFPTTKDHQTRSYSKDTRFVEHLQKVHTFLKLNTSIDKLLEHQNDLYNKETYKYFHSLLYEILERFVESLDALKTFHHQPEIEGKMLSSTQLRTAKEKIDFILTVGTLLNVMVKSVAVKKCLQTIVTVLPDRVASGLKPKFDDEDGPNELEGGDDLDGDDGLELDELELDELEEDCALEPDGSQPIKVQLKPKSQAFMKLLNMAVIYFDAILRLSHFVKDQNRTTNVKISAKILLMPTMKQDERMLPWETLLQHETYFPGKPSPSAKEILDFLKPIPITTNVDDTSTKLDKRSQQSGKKSGKKDQQSGKKSQQSGKKGQPLDKKSLQQPTSKNRQKPISVTPAGIAQDLAKLQHTDNSDAFSEKIDSVIHLMETLRYGDAAPGSMTYVHSIVKKLQSVKNTPIYCPDKTDAEINNIIGMLTTLSDNVMLEGMLRKGSPLDLGIGFKGTYHCEANIAAYCTFKDPMTWIPKPSVSRFIKFCLEIPDVFWVGCPCASNRRL